MFLLEEGEVATVSGSAFGDNNCIRISIASSENDLITAISELKNAYLNYPEMFKEFIKSVSKTSVIKLVILF